MIVLLGGARLELDRARVVHPDAEVPLSPTEVRLLAYLAARRGVFVAKDELLREVWGYHPGVSSRSVDHALSRLRAKLEPGGSAPGWLVSRYGQGLMLERCEALPAVLAEAPMQAASGRDTTSQSGEEDDPGRAVVAEADALRARGQVPEALGLLHRALPTGSTAVRDALAALAAIHGDRALARRLLDDQLREARARGDTATEARALGNLSILDRDRGAVDLAFERMDAARERFLALGMLHLAAHARASLAYLRLARSEPTAAEEARAALDGLVAVGHQRGTTNGRLVLGLALLVAGRRVDAEAELHRAQVEATTLGDARLGFAATAWLGVNAALCGEPALAAERLTPAFEHFLAYDAARAGALAAFLVRVDGSSRWLGEATRGLAHSPDPSAGALLAILEGRSPTPVPPGNFAALAHLLQRLPAR